MAQGGIEAEEEVIAAIATPPGSGAIGMLRLSGRGCLDVAGRFIKWNRAPAPRTAGLVEAFSEDGRLLDRGVAIFYPGGSSYTGEEMVEITTHGSPFILSALLDSAQKAGARTARPGEFTQRAFLNGRMDLAQAEAVAALIRARTSAAHRIALSQMEGALSRRLAAVRAETLDCLADLEAGLDHPEEDIPELGSAALKERLEKISVELAELARTQHAGRLWTEGARVAILGTPNVGKSSLLNAVLGRDRAIVAETPGTTRDTLEEPADIGGIPVVLTDTAGLRDRTDDPAEQMGMERSRRALANADLALFVLDRSRPPREEERALLREIRSSPRPLLFVLNKSDLPGNFSYSSMLGGEEPILEVSALRGTGIPALTEAVARALKDSARCDAEGDALLINARHRRAVEEAQSALSLAAGAAENRELASIHVREALSHIGAVVGDTTADDVLRAIFSKFCVGK